MELTVVSKSGVNPCCILLKNRSKPEATWTWTWTRTRQFKRPSECNPDSACTCISTTRFVVHAAAMARDSWSGS
jgi:hypothetical protein